jgi:hypothetical protein
MNRPVYIRNQRGNLIKLENKSPCLSEIKRRDPDQARKQIEGTLLKLEHKSPCLYLKSKGGSLTNKSPCLIVSEIKGGQDLL